MVAVVDDKFELPYLMINSNIVIFPIDLVLSRFGYSLSTRVSGVVGTVAVCKTCYLNKPIYK